MRRGMRPAILANDDGAILAIGTGSDACAEHEQGAAPLISALTGEAAPYASDIGELQKSQPDYTTPKLLETLRIRRELENICFEVQEVKGEKEAVLGFSARGRVEGFGKGFIATELYFPTFSEPKNIAGAWDESGFAIKVRGKELVNQLVEFAKAMKEGRTMFASKCFPHSTLSGVVIAREDLLGPEQFAALEQAQVRFEAEVELYRRSRAQEIIRLAAKVSRFGFFYAWPVWADKPYGEIVYRVNPGRGFNMPYGTSASFEELTAWLNAGAKEPFVATA